MNSDVNDILQLPEKSLLQRRLTKVFFTKHFKLNATERRLLNNVIKSMQWLVSLKPATCNVASSITDEYSFDEIQIFTVQLSDVDFDKYYKPVSEFIQRHVPYQILLILESENQLAYSVADKRINQSDKTKRTVESYYHTPIINTLYQRDIEKALDEAMQFRQLQKDNLATVYQSYVSAIVQYQSACITGSYIARDHKRTVEDISVLKEIESTEAEMINIKSQLKKESQFNRKMEKNVELQKKKNQIEELKAKLSQ